MPDETESGVVALHAVRYEFARAFCEDAEVLDAACGVGYGSAILAASARRVLGVDRDEESILYARARYATPTVEFRTMDVTSLDLPDVSFDVVCSFETLEHLDEPERAVAEAARVLRPAGVLVASTPRAAETTRSPDNPWHRVELSPNDFEQLLRAHFVDVRLYGQVRRQTKRHRIAQRLDVLGLRRRVPLARRASAGLLGTPATEAGTLADVEIVAGELNRATEIVAVCRRA